MIQGTGGGGGGCDGAVAGTWEPIGGPYIDPGWWLSGQAAWRRGCLGTHLQELTRGGDEGWKHSGQREQHV